MNSITKVTHKDCTYEVYQGKERVLLSPAMIPMLSVDLHMLPEHARKVAAALIAAADEIDRLAAGRKLTDEVEA